MATGKRKKGPGKSGRSAKSGGARNQAARQPQRLLQAAGAVPGGRRELANTLEPALVQGAERMRNRAGLAIITDAAAGPLVEGTDLRRFLSTDPDVEVREVDPAQAATRIARAIAGALGSL